MSINLKDAQPRNPKVQAVLDAEPGPSGEAARWLAELVRSTVKGSVEGLYHRMPTWAGAQGPAFVHVETYAKHANLGFSYGINLEDPDGLLQGSGKGYRFVRVSAPGAVPKTKLVKFIKAAAKDAKERA